MGKAETKSKAVRTTPMPVKAGAACGCAVGQGVGKDRPGGHAVGPGASAAGVDRDIKASNLKHLKRIEGQVRGIAAMIEEDRYCADIIQQAAAVQESLRSVARNLLKNHLQHCASDAMHEQGKRRDDMIEEVLHLVSRIAR